MIKLQRYFEHHTLVTLRPSRSQNGAGGAAHGQGGGQLDVLLPEAVPLAVEERTGVLQPVGGLRRLRPRVGLGHLQLGPLVVFSLFGFLLLLRLGRDGGGLVSGLWWRQGVQGEVVRARLPFRLLLTAGDVQGGGHALGVGACRTSVVTHG